MSATAPDPSQFLRAFDADTDVIVVGGGGAGLAASIEARSLGRRVVLLEKNPQLGGSTAWSVGSISATNTPHQRRKGILDSPDDHFDDMGKFCAMTGLPDNPALRRVLFPKRFAGCSRWVSCSTGRCCSPRIGSRGCITCCRIRALTSFIWDAARDG